MGKGVWRVEIQKDAHQQHTGASLTRLLDLGAGDHYTRKASTTAAPERPSLALPRTSRRLRLHADADSSRQRSSLLVLRLQMRDHSRLRHRHRIGREAWLRQRAWQAERKRHAAIRKVLERTTDRRGRVHFNGRFFSARCNFTLVLATKGQARN
jgi:hypothetical protein